MLHAGQLNLSEEHHKAFAEMGAKKLLRLPQRRATHHAPARGAEVKRLIETGDLRGKTWHVAAVKRERDEPYLGDAAETNVKQLAAACFPHSITIQCPCSAWLLLRAQDQVPEER